MKVLRQMLLKREKQNEQINVAVIGTGWFGSGLIRELCHWPGIIPRLVVTLTTDKAIQAFKHAGISSSEIFVINSAKEYTEALSNKYIVSNNLELLKELKGIDVVFEATGDVLIGAQAALDAIAQGTHFITANIEMDSTLGFAIDKRAKEKGVVYSVADGDQPGVISRMIDEIKLYGFEIIVAGNCKGFLDFYQTPEGVLPWVRPGHNPKRISSFADGTKQSFELAVLANDQELTVDTRGMHGPSVTRATLIDGFLKIIKKLGIVDYTMGINGIDEGAGVFVIVKRDDEFVSADMDYLKKGKGPYYLFFRDYHLCYFEAAKTIAEAILFNTPTLSHKSKMADVLSVAKKDLKAGKKLDGIGGFCAYGLIDKADIFHKQHLLPIGISEYAVATKSIKKDEPITYHMVDFPEDNTALKLRREEEEILKEQL